MPYSHNTLKIPRELDKRVKLTLKDRSRIKALYATGKYSQRQLARRFGVSRRLVTYYIDDSKLSHHKELSATRRIDKRYYDKDKHREYMRNHRQHKQELAVKGLLV